MSVRAETLADSRKSSASIETSQKTSSIERKSIFADFYKPAGVDSVAEKKLVEAMVADAVEFIKKAAPSWPLEYEWLFNDDYPGGLRDLVGEEADFFRRLAKQQLQ